MQPSDSKTDKLNVDGSLTLWAALFIAFFCAVEISAWVAAVDPVKFAGPALVISVFVLIIVYGIFRQG